MYLRYKKVVKGTRLVHSIRNGKSADMLLKGIFEEKYIVPNLFHSNIFAYGDLVNIYLCIDVL